MRDLKCTLAFSSAAAVHFKPHLTAPWARLQHWTHRRSWARLVPTLTTKRPLALKTCALLTMLVNDAVSATIHSSNTEPSGTACLCLKPKMIKLKRISKARPIPTWVALGF